MENYTIPATENSVEKFQEFFDVTNAETQPIISSFFFQ